MKSSLALICLCLISVATCGPIAYAQPVTKIASNQTPGQLSAAALPGSLAIDPLPQLGDLGLKLNTPTTITVTTLEGPFRGFDGGPNLRVKKIGGVATQQMIQMPMRALKADADAGWEQFEVPGNPALVQGKTYELRGYETGKYIDDLGNPVDPSSLAQPSTADIHLSSTSSTGEIEPASSESVFRNEFIVLEAKEVEPIVWSPADFVDREALITGTAKNVGKIAIIEGKDWKLALGPKPWEPWQVGRSAEAFCKIKTSNIPQTFVASDCSRRLTELQDQAGQSVTLRGIARTHNNMWWFNYRGTDLYFDSLNPRSDEYTTLQDWDTIEVTGLLQQAVLPPNVRYIRGYKDDRETVFILRGPAWKATKLTEMETPYEN